MELKPRWRNETLMRKAEIYYFKQDYDSAIKTLQQVDGELPFTNFKDILINKMKVKQAQISGDTILRDSLYKVIADDYEKSFQNGLLVHEKVLKMKDEYKVFHSWTNTILVELFYYKLQLEGPGAIIRQIDSLQEATEGNKMYFDHLKKVVTGSKNDFMVFFE